MERLLACGAQAEASWGTWCGCRRVRRQRRGRGVAPAVPADSLMPSRTGVRWSGVQRGAGKTGAGILAIVSGREQETDLPQGWRRGRGRSDRGRREEGVPLRRIRRNQDKGPVFQSGRGCPRLSVP